MDFDFSEEQRSLGETVRRFLAEQAPIAYVREMYDDQRGTTDRVWRGLAELGVTGILVPEKFGGLGLGMVDMGVVVEEMGRAVHPGPFVSSAVAATAAVVNIADDSAQADLLPAMASGEHMATLALLEPASRYEWREPATRADLSGSQWNLTGTKAHVTDGVAADLMLVVARAPGGLGLFLAESGLYQAVAEPVLDGSRKQASITFEATPARRIDVGDSAAVTAGVARALDLVLIALVVDAVGAAQAALDICLEYARVREQFGRPIGSFQALQHMCVDMFRDIEMSRVLGYYGLWASDVADNVECHRAAVTAKGFASDALAKVGADAIQVHGGIGFTWEHDIHLYYKRCLSMRNTLGASVEHLAELASLIV
jgi:alkylation response protein AidB-like acyl-CoA dehydrogenase